MNFAPSIGAASTFAAGGADGAVDGLACASAPETISVLTAADIMRVFNIAASKRVCSVKESGASLRTNNSRARGCSAKSWNCGLTMASICALQHTVRGRHRLALRADARSEVKSFHADVGRLPTRRR